MLTTRRLLALALVSAAVFVWQLPRLWPLVPLGKALDPAAQEAAAQAHLVREGVPIQGFRAAAELAIDDLALDHADSLLGRSATLALADRQWLVGTAVTFKRRGSPDVIVAWVDPRGRVSRWLWMRQDDDSAGTADSASAARMAFAALDRVTHDTIAAPWTLIGASIRERPRRVDRTFTVERVVDASHGLKERASLTVSGNVVSGVLRNLVVPDDARRARTAAQAPTIVLSSIGVLALAAGIIVAFGILLRGLRDGSAQIGPPARVAALVFAGVVATFFLEPAWLQQVWEPLWPWITAPLLGLQRIGLTNAWLGLVLFTVIAAGDAEDRRAGANRAASLWRAVAGHWRDPEVGRAAWQGWLVGLLCGGVMAGSVALLQSGVGAPTALQPRGFFVKVLDAWSPSLTALLFFTSVALAEELGYRLYFGTWIERLTGRRWMAIWGPALLYGLTHTNLDFLPPAGPFWARPLVLTLVGATWGWAFFRYGALTVVLSHLTADLFIFNWPRLANGDWSHTASAAAVIVLPLVPALVARRASQRPPQ
ncbi:MAG: CPBP family intramembrane glutamic endopeptidase [Gemmatimonadaceae bacterium]|nr:CPBP family intramembrane glutamic endopeptidase [Gemmatimonadaceae bacterium]